MRYAQVQNQKDGMENSGKLLKNSIDEECEIFRAQIYNEIFRTALARIIALLRENNTRTLTRNI